MAYSVQADLEAEIASAKVIQLTDDDNNGTADPVVVARAIAKADSIIDTKLKARYGAKVPFSTVPEIVKTLSIDLAIVSLYRRQGTGERAEGSLEPGQYISPREKEAYKMLGALADGSLLIPELATTGERKPESSTDNFGHIFTRSHKDTDGEIIETTKQSMDTW